MYKKIMLSFMILSLVSNSESLYADDATNKIAECIAYITTTIIENGAEIITGIAVGAGTAVCGSIIYTTKNTYEWIRPTPENTANTEEARVRAQEARERTAFLDAKANFRKCLADPTKSKSIKNSDGVPTDCEKEVSAFIICGGYHDAIQMTSDFGRTK